MNDKFIKLFVLFKVNTKLRIVNNLKSLRNILLLAFSIAYSCLYGQVKNNGNLRMHSASQMGLFGDFTNEGTFNNNLGTLHAAGSQPQVFNGSNLIQANNFTINKGSDAVQLDNILRVDSTLTFTNGLITSDRSDIATEYVEFGDDAISVNHSDTSHIDGVIRKVGDDEFTFPTGDNNILRPVSISSPSNTNDHFTTYYTDNDPNAAYSRSSTDSNIDHVSACEYWILNRTNGSSNVEVSLSWDSNSCGIDNLCDLVVARWDGSQWTSEGNGGTSGTTAMGSVVSGTSCTTPSSVTNFSPFTLASTTKNNPLPIELISFDAEICDRSVCLEWRTESEINNDYFTIERSNDGINWEVVQVVDGQGNSNSSIKYETVDNKPYSGLSYYKLKQTDFNGDFEYTSTKTVYVEKPNEGEISIYPNPAKQTLLVDGLINNEEKVNIFNSVGREVTELIKMMYLTDLRVQLDVSRLKPGVYYIQTENIYKSFVKL